VEPQVQGLLILASGGILLLLGALIAKKLGF
jgi:hypothetical protein